jgi:hypothetical protein
LLQKSDKRNQIVSLRQQVNESGEAMSIHWLSVMRADWLKLSILATIKV